MNAEMIEQETIKRLETELYNANYNLNKAKAYIAELEEDLFQRAFCAALGGLRANPNVADLSGGHEILVKHAILDAQEAVRQVGAMATSSNLEAVEPSGNPGELDKWVLKDGNYFCKTCGERCHEFQGASA